MARSDDQLKCPFCKTTVVVSDEDEDRSFRKMLTHIKGKHSEKNQRPTNLWDQIDIVR
jgi:hypothetical protein